MTRVDIEAGTPAHVPVRIVNTTDVIDGVTARVLGLPANMVRTTPDTLGLFPEASGEMVLTLDLPESFPAGTHLVTVEITGRATGAAVAHHDLELVVAARPRLAATAAPSRVRARRRADFTVQVTNTGNVPLDASLRASDTERTLRCEPEPSALSLPPGGTRSATVHVGAPLRWTGSDQDRAVVLTVTAGDLTQDVPLVLRQRPLLSRGLITILTLLAIVAVWAVVLLVGIRGALGAEPLTKTAPASFFAATSTGAGAAPVGAAPDGSLPKDGAVSGDVGAAVTGRVVAASSGQGVGRLTVEALRRTRDGLVVVGSAASQDDGGYTIAGLFPGTYLLRVSAEGYDDVWYPGSPDEGGATQVRARARDAATDVDVVVTGHPATIVGSVSTGEQDTEVTVTARPTWSDDETEQVSVTADAGGGYTLTGLEAPGTYEISVTADGYQPATIRETVGGGQERFAADVQLGSVAGEISGLVTSNGQPLGGVTVSTVVDGVKVAVGTPTLGTVGRFVLPGLATPGTYMLTFTKDGFGARTLVVDLGPGESRTDLRVALSDGVGTVTGRVLGAGGAGLGGAVVTVQGGAGPVTVTTLTSGDVGGFVVTGLVAPGSYTVSVVADGYATQSVPVDLGTTGSVSGLRVRLTASAGALTGTVSTAGTAHKGAEVTVTDGATTWSTVTSDTGGYSFAGLVPGTYTVTAVTSGGARATGLARVTAGAEARRDLAPGGS